MSEYKSPGIASAITARNLSVTKCTFCPPNIDLGGPFHSGRRYEISAPSIKNHRKLLARISRDGCVPRRTLAVHHECLRRVPDLRSQQSLTRLTHGNQIAGPHLYGAKVSHFVLHTAFTGLARPKEADPKVQSNEPRHSKTHASECFLTVATRLCSATDTEVCDPKRQKWQTHENFKYCQYID